MPPSFGDIINSEKMMFKIYMLTVVLALCVVCCRETSVKYSGRPAVYLVGFVTGGLKQLYDRVMHQSHKPGYSMLCLF